MESKVYFHNLDEFDSKYKDREGKKGRAMISKMFQMLDEYQGQFEEEKDEEDHIRKVFKKFIFDIENDESRLSLEDEVMRYFGKLDEGNQVRQQFRLKAKAKEDKKFSFKLMLEWVPELTGDHRKGIQVVKDLKEKFGQNKSVELENWIEENTRDYIREQVIIICKDRGFICEN